LIRSTTQSLEQAVYRMSKIGYGRTAPLPEDFPKMPPYEPDR
jgi:hypothetical protein